MPDNTDMAGGQDRARAGAEQQYKLSSFASRHGISTDEAGKILTQAGPGREAANAAAERSKQT